VNCCENRKQDPKPAYIKEGQVEA